MIPQKHGIASPGLQRPSKKRKVKPVTQGSGEDVLLSDIKALLQKCQQASMSNCSASNIPSSVSDTTIPFSRFDELDVEIQELGSLGLATIC